MGLYFDIIDWQWKSFKKISRLSPKGGILIKRADKGVKGKVKFFICSLKMQSRVEELPHSILTPWVKALDAAEGFHLQQFCRL